MTIYHASKQFGVSQRLIRLCEGIGLVAKAARRDSGGRDYDEKDVHTVSSGGSRLKMRFSRSIWTAVSVSKFFAILVAAAMLFAPFAMQSSRAMAATPSDHHAQMTDQGHCDGRRVSDKDGTSADKPCCAAMCAAVAIAAGSPVDRAVFAPSIDRPAVEQFRHGFLAKLPTPPPRLA